MPKNKVKKVKVRGTKRATKAAPKSFPAAQENTHHEDVLTGLVDPFSAHAAVAKYPDAGSARTLTFQQRMQIPISTAAGGVLAIAFNPKVNFPLLVYSGAAGNVITWPAAWQNDFAANLVNTYSKLVRLSSYGVRVINTLSATNSSGTLVIAKGGPPVLSGTTTFDPSNFTDWEMHPMVHGGEWHVHGLPKGLEAYTFKPPDTYNTSTSIADDSWETIYVYLSGGPASASCITLEAVFNFEYTPKEDSPIAALASPQPVLNVGVQTAVNEIQSNHPPSFKGGRAVVQNFIKKEAKKAILKHILPFAAKKATQFLL